MAWRGFVDEDLDSYVSARAGAIRFAEFINASINDQRKGK